MKIAIYSPYLDTTGGGEKYILTIASVLSEKSQVDVLLDNHLSSVGIQKVIEKIDNLHKIDVSKVNFIHAPIGKGSSFFKRLKFLSGYDWVFYLTDGSIFFSTAKNNVIHFQVPFQNLSQGWWNRVKLSSWNMAIYNSNFTKSHIERVWPIKGEVIYPPVNVESFIPSKDKGKHIISVGRFFGYLKDKKHEFLIDSFKRLVDKEKITDWSLHLVGSMNDGDVPYVDELTERAKGYKVLFHPNAQFEVLKKLYGQSRIYWHASGFEETNPEKFEHFGIVIVEAMSAGCIPVVIAKGGPEEIIEDGKSGLLWEDQDELLAQTIKLINSSKVKIKNLVENCINRSKDFSEQKFAEKIKRLVYGK